MKSILRTAIVSLIFTFPLTLTADEPGTNEWLQFRGDQGVSTAKGIPVKWGLENGVAWKMKLPGKGWSSPVITKGKVIMTYSNQEEEKVTLGVVALDVKTGEVRWNRELFTPEYEVARKHHHKNGLASPTPFIEGEVIVAHFGHMGTAALKVEDGGVNWKQEQITYIPVHGSGGSPIVVDDVVVINADGRSDPVIVGLDLKTGDVKWKTPRDQEVKKKFSFGTPLALKIDGRTQVISQASGKVSAYAPKDGSEIWKVRYGEGYSVVPRPIYANGLIYVATGFDRPTLLAINPQGAKGDVTDTHVVFKEEKFIPKTPSFVERNGYLYLVDDTGSLTCRDAKSGEMKWREKLPGNFSSSPVLVGDKLYLATEDGVAYVVEVSPAGGKILFELDMEDRIFASPAMIDGALFIRSEEFLWKIVK